MSGQNLLTASSVILDSLDHILFTQGGSYQ